MARKPKSRGSAPKNQAPKARKRAPARTVAKQYKKAPKRQVAAKYQKAPKATRRQEKLNSTFNKRLVRRAEKLGLITEQKTKQGKTRKRITKTQLRRAKLATKRAGGYVNPKEYTFIPMPRGKKAKAKLLRDARRSGIAVTEKGLFVRRIGKAKPKLVYNKKTGLYRVTQRGTKYDKKTGKTRKTRQETIIAGVDDLARAQNKLAQELKRFKRQVRYGGLADSRTFRFRIGVGPGSEGNESNFSSDNLDDLLEFIFQYVRNRPENAQIKALETIRFEVVDMEDEEGRCQKHNKDGERCRLDEGHKGKHRYGDEGE